MMVAMDELWSRVREGAVPFAVGLALVVLASVWVTLWVRRRLDRHARQRRSVRAQRAEHDAAGVLAARGFDVLGRQVRQSWALSVDGEELRFALVADYVVEREGRRWVAEVKTGERALDLRYGPTRRQLLEYREAFAVEGVLLVDAEGQSLREVHFRQGPPARSRGRLGLFAAGVLVGFGLAAYWFGSEPAAREPRQGQRQSGSGLMRAPASQWVVAMHS